jgi:photosystem II stability/assembly factor-like uncharacterized protein
MIQYAAVLTKNNCRIIDWEKRVVCTCVKHPFLLIDDFAVVVPQHDSMILDCEHVNQGKRGFCTGTKHPFLLIDDLAIKLFFVNAAEYCQKQR